MSAEHKEPSKFGTWEVDDNGHSSYVVTLSLRSFFAVGECSSKSAEHKETSKFGIREVDGCGCTDEISASSNVAGCGDEDTWGEFTVGLVLSSTGYIAELVLAQSDRKEIIKSQSLTSA